MDTMKLRGPALVAMLGLLTACPTGGSGTPIELQDSENYYFLSDVGSDFSTVAASTDTTVDWSGLTTDMYGRAIDPSAEISLVQLTWFKNLEPQDLMLKVSDDSLAGTDVSGTVDFEPTGGETSALLSEFSFLGTMLDPTDPEQYGEGGSYLMSIWTDGVTGVRMLQGFVAVSGADVVDIVIDNDSGTVDYEIDLARGDIIPGTGTLIDWSDLSTNMAGSPLAINKLDTLLVARFDETVEELESNFLRLEDNAEDFWSINVEGLGNYDIDGGVDRNGTAFDGWTDEGIWLLGLRCSTCLNPAPLFLGIVEPAEAEVK